MFFVLITLRPTRSTRTDTLFPSRRVSDLNAWFGDYDKATMAAELLADDLGIDPQEQSRRVLFIGDAPNDESLFRACALSVGVANIKPHLNNFAHHPRWVCDAGHGAGFVEMADRVLQARQLAGESMLETRIAPA